MERVACIETVASDSEKCRVVVVLGMHRNATGSVACGLQVLGVDFGKGFTRSASHGCKGFWEDRDIAALNGDMLGALGGDGRIAAMPQADGLAVEFQQRALDLLAERLAGIDCFGMADPRMARLLPVWEKVFRQLRVGVAYVIAFRHPMGATPALARRADREKCYRLWLEHMLSCIAATQGRARLVVDCDAMTDDPVGQLRRLAHRLGRPFEPEAAVFADGAGRVVDPGPRHPRYGLPDLLLENSCPPGVVELYKVLSRLATDEAGFDSPEVAMTLARAGGSWRGFLPQTGHVQLPDESAADALSELQVKLGCRDEQLADLSRLIAERDGRIGALLQSHCWRFTAPLRVLGYQARRTKAAYRFGKTLLGAFGGGWPLLRKAASVAVHDGWRGLRHRIGNTLTYYKSTGRVLPRTRYIEATSPEDVLDMDRVANGPLLAIIIPVYDPPEEMLEAAIMSVRDQVYGHWELILVDDKSGKPHVAETIRRHADADTRIRAYLREENGNISAALNTGLGMCTAEHFAILDHDDILDRTALYWVARSLLEQPDVDYLYSDEDKVSKDGQRFYGAFYKPDWSPEYFLAMMYTCHLGVYRTSLVRELGGYRSEFDGAQDYDLTLRVVSRARKVAHIPRILYHWRVWEQSTAGSLEAKPYAESRARRALEECLSERGENFSIENGPLPGHHKVLFLPKGDPLVSIVIPTANRKIKIRGRFENHIDAVIRSIFEKSSYRNFEVVVVHNGNLSREQIAALRERGNIKLVAYEEKTFDLSKKINLGCSQAAGEYLLIMNDDVRVVSGNWLEAMLGMVQRDGVGIVGAKLLFPDETIQHAGVVILGGLPGHAYYRWPGDSEGYALGVKVDRNYIAVTGACAMTPKKLFDEIGGFSSRYPLNYNDVDYCLKLQRRGYRSVYMADVVLYHYEGVSKEGGRSVADSEISKFLEDWADVYSHDPYYNRNLSQNVPYQFG